MTLPHPHTSDTQGVHLCTFGDTQYAVWYTLGGEVMVGKRDKTSEVWGTDHEEHLISGAARTVLQLPVEDDEHNDPVICRDRLGYLHVFANLHTDPLKYIVSDNPDDITAWSEGTLPGSGSFTRWTYPTFAPLPNGDFFFYIRCGASVTGSGRSDSYFWWNINGVWSAAGTRIFQGVSVPGAGPGGTVGTDGATDDEYNWNAYPNTPLVEDRGNGEFRVHLFFVWREIFNQVFSNDLPSYIYYDSATTNWHAVDGTTLTLPIHRLNNLACQTGLSLDDGYMNSGGLCLDDDGYPHAVISQIPHMHIWWNGSSWQQEELTTLDDVWELAGVRVRSRLNCFWRQGALWLLGVGGTVSERYTYIWKADGTVGFPLGGQVPNSGWESQYDPEALRLNGTVEVLVPDGNSPRVATFGDHARRSAES